MFGPLLPRLRFSFFYLSFGFVKKQLRILFLLVGFGDQFFDLLPLALNFLVFLFEFLSLERLELVFEFLDLAIVLADVVLNEGELFYLTLLLVYLRLHQFRRQLGNIFVDDRLV